MTGLSSLLWHAIHREFRKNRAFSVCNIDVKLILNWKSSDSLICRADEKKKNIMSVSRGFDSRWGHWILNWPNPSSRTVALGSTHPLTEMSTRNLPGGKGWLARGADNLTAICQPIVYKMWEPQRLTSLWAFTACYRDSFIFFYLYHLL
jgi:hypothetical protein